MDEDPRNIEGEAHAITTLSTVRWWGQLWLPVLFAMVRRVPRLTATLRDLKFIYFARWTLIRQLPYNGPPQRRGKLRYAHLFFASNFTGDWDEYIEAFSRRLTQGMRTFWGSSFGFPGAVPVEPFKAYIRRHELTADHFYSAYPHATTAGILRALKLAGEQRYPTAGEVEGARGGAVLPKPDRDAVGQARAFMAWCPVQPSEADALIEYLRGPGPSPFGESRRTHMARMLVIRDFPAEPEAEEHLDVPYLVFTTNFDGDLDSYLDELRDVFAGHIAAIWGRCINGPVDPAGLKAYLLHNRIPTGLFYAAYGHATVQEVLDALERFPAAETWVSGTPRVRIHVERAKDIVLANYERKLADESIVRPAPHTGEAGRDQHEEGCVVEGRLTIRDDIPADLRHGLFAKSATFDVLARFSPNGSVPNVPFIRPPIGMALKVRTENGTQDFVLGGTRTFFCRDAEDAVELVKAQARGMRGLTRFFFPSVNPARWRLRELRNMTITLTQRFPNPLRARFFSMMPVMCGPAPVMVSIQGTPLRSRKKMTVHDALVEELSETATTMRLLVQRQGEADPLNDPTVEWTGEWVDVGAIWFPAQDTRGGEHMEFSPGHHLPEHEPVGEVMEVRVAAYDAVAARRHELNKVPRPTE